MISSSETTGEEIRLDYEELQKVGSCGISKHGGRHRYRFDPARSTIMHVFSCVFLMKVLNCTTLRYSDIFERVVATIDIINYKPWSINAFAFQAVPVHSSRFTVHWMNACPHLLLNVSSAG